MMFEDPIYSDVKEAMAWHGTWTVSQIQRRWEIGYNRAYRLTERLVAEGILSEESDMSGRRRTLVPTEVKRHWEGGTKETCDCPDCGSSLIDYQGE